MTMPGSSKVETANGEALNTEAVQGEAITTTTGGGEVTTPQNVGFMGQWGGLISMVVIFLVFYLVFMLPQKKQEKKQKAMLNAMVPGDEVITIGGIYGNIVSVKDDTVVIESSADKTKIKIAKSSISRCLTVHEDADVKKK